MTPRNLLLALIVCTAAALPLAASPQNAEHGTFDFGFEQRVRNENWDNVFDFNSSTDDQRNQVRYRTRAWAKAPITSNIDVYAGLMQETNQIVVKRAPYRFDEVAFENLYVDFKKFLVKGLSLRVGRQNLTKGEGFLVFEGNPWDGSRSIYFNAVNLAYTWKKSQLEVIGILNPYRDRFLPRIHDKSRQLVEWDEQALGAYYTDKNHKDTTFEAYYFYKKEVHDRRSPINAQFQPDRHINTAGSRVARKLKHDWDAAGEFALQWGAQHPSTSLAGWAGYGYVKKSWKQAPWKPSLQGGYWAFSGDNPTSGSKNEGWDPLFSRWPKWSELYIYSQLRERGVGYWTNEGMWQAEMQFAPTKLLGGRLTYYHMDSFHRFPGAPQIYGMGTDRGNHYQARLDVNVNKYWKGHVLYERHQPGDFYTGHSPAYFLRFEVIFNVKASIAHS